MYRLQLENHKNRASVSFIHSFIVWNWGRAGMDKLAVLLLFTCQLVSMAAVVDCQSGGLETANFHVNKKIYI